MKEELKDQLAERILGIIDTIGPITNEILLQYSLKHKIIAGGFGSITIFCMVCLCISIYHIKKLGMPLADKGGFVALLIASFAGGILAYMACMSSIVKAVTPLISILGL